MVTEIEYLSGLHYVLRHLIETRQHKRFIKLVEDAEDINEINTILIVIQGPISEAEWLKDTRLKLQKRMNNLISTHES